MCACASQRDAIEGTARPSDVSLPLTEPKPVAASSYEVPLSS